MAGKFVMLLVSRSSLSARSGHTPAVAEGLEASFARRTSPKDTGWLVWALSGIPVSGLLACAAARMAALFPVAAMRAASPRAESKNAVRARRNMVAH